MLLHRSAEPHQSRDRGTVCKEKRATSYLYDDEHVTMTLLLTSGSNHTIHIFVEHTAPHRRGGANQNDHRPHPTGGVEGTRHVTMTLLLTSGSNHTIRLPRYRRGGANQKDHRPHSGGGGGGDEAKQDQTRKATRPNKTTTHLTGKGGYHGVGGGGRVWQPCIIYPISD